MCTALIVMQKKQPAYTNCRKCCRVIWDIFYVLSAQKVQMFAKLKVDSLENTSWYIDMKQFISWCRGRWVIQTQCIILRETVFSGFDWVAWRIDYRRGTVEIMLNEHYSGVCALDPTRTDPTSPRPKACVLPSDFFFQKWMKMKSDKSSQQAQM